MNKGSKKTLTVFLGLLILGSMAALAVDAAADAAIPIAAKDEVIVNGQPLANHKTRTENGIQMLPLRSVSEALGYEVVWFPEDGHIEMCYGAKFISLRTDVNSYAFGKMAPIELVCKPIVVKGVTYVPPSFFELIGAVVAENEASFSISSPLSDDTNTAGLEIREIHEDFFVARQGEGEAIVKFDEDTRFFICNEDKEASANAFSVGDMIRVKHPSIMILIYPPQYQAIEIEKLVDCDFKQGIVSEVREDGIVVSRAGEMDVVLLVTEDTTLKNERGDDLSLASIRVGNRVEAYHSLASTKSIPPQTVAYAIVVDTHRT